MQYHLFTLNSINVLNCNMIKLEVHITSTVNGLEKQNENRVSGLYFSLIHLLNLKTYKYGFLSFWNLKNRVIQMPTYNVSRTLESNSRGIDRNILVTSKTKNGHYCQRNNGIERLFRIRNTNLNFYNTIHTNTYTIYA